MSPRATAPTVVSERRRSSSSSTSAQNSPLVEDVDVVLRVPAHRREARRVDGDLRVRAEAAEDDVEHGAEHAAR